MTIDEETDERNGTRRNATGVRGVRDDDSKGRTGGSACAVSVLCEHSLSLVRVCARACVVALKPTDASNGRSNGAGVYPRASADAACEDACGRSRERRARAI